MCSKSSSKRPPSLVPVGRVRGHRGKDGELTVDAFVEDAGLWTEARRFWLEDARGGAGAFRSVVNARSYRNRLVLKLESVDDANTAAGLRGLQVFADPAEAVGLPEDAYFADQLIGYRVVDDTGRALGRVDGVLATGGADVLRVVASGDRDGEDDEILIPLAREIVTEIDDDGETVKVSLPGGLETMNR